MTSDVRLTPRTDSYLILTERLTTSSTPYRIEMSIWIDSEPISTARMMRTTIRDHKSQTSGIELQLARERAPN